MFKRESEKEDKGEEGESVVLFLIFSSKKGFQCVYSVYRDVQNIYSIFFLTTHAWGNYHYRSLNLYLFQFEHSAYIFVKI